MYLPLSAPARSRSTVSEREFKKLKDDVRANEKKVKSSKTSWAPCKTWLWLWPAIPPGCARNSSLYSSRPDKSSRALFCNLSYNGEKQENSGGRADRGPPLKVRLYKVLVRSLVLACEKFPVAAEVAKTSDFIGLLRRELGQLASPAR